MDLRSLPGPKVYVLGRRIHHGFVGCFLLALGALFVVHDLHDRGDWFHFR